MIGVVLAASLINANARVWKDKKGNAVEAEYVGFEKATQGMMIKLKSAKGDIKLPFKLLSDGDQAYIKEQVVPLEELEREGVAWAKDILRHSPLAIRMLKSSFNAELDGQAGIQELAGNATLLFYMNEEAQEGRDAYNEKRAPDFSRFPWRP